MEKKEKYKTNKKEEKNMEKHTLRDWAIYLDDQTGNLCVSLTYLLETDKKIDKLHIPCVVLPINANCYPAIDESHNDYYASCGVNVLDQTYKFRAGYAPLTITKVNKVVYTIETIEEKVREVTLSDLEKELGCKLKIIAEDKKK